MSSDVITTRIGASPSYEDAVAFADAACASHGVEHGELFVTQTYKEFFNVPTINLIRVESNGAGAWIVQHDWIPVAWASEALKLEAGVS